MSDTCPAVVTGNGGGTLQWHLLQEAGVAEDLCHLVREVLRVIWFGEGTDTFPLDPISDSRHGAYDDRATAGNVLVDFHRRASDSRVALPRERSDAEVAGADVKGDLLIGYFPRESNPVIYRELSGERFECGSSRAVPDDE